MLTCRNCGEIVTSSISTFCDDLFVFLEFEAPGGSSSSASKKVKVVIVYKLLNEMSKFPGKWALVGV